MRIQFAVALALFCVLAENVLNVQSQRWDTDNWRWSPRRGGGGRNWRPRDRDNRWGREGIDRLIQRCTLVAVEDESREPGTIIAVRRFQNWYGWGRGTCILYYVAYPDPTTDITETTTTEEPSESDSTDVTGTTVSEGPETSLPEEPTTLSEQLPSQPTINSASPESTGAPSNSENQPNTGAPSVPQESSTTSSAVSGEEPTAIFTSAPIEPTTGTPPVSENQPTAAPISVAETQSTTSAPSVPQGPSTTSSAVSGEEPTAISTSAPIEPTTGAPPVSENQPTAAPISVTETQSTTGAPTVPTAASS